MRLGDERQTLLWMLVAIYATWFMWYAAAAAATAAAVGELPQLPARAHPPTFPRPAPTHAT